MGIGLIRLLLAESVVMSHSYGFFGYHLFNSIMAVEMFFIISGFYMAMILSDKYADYWMFIKNRFLRLYPIYISLIILAVIISVGTFFAFGNWFRLYAYLDHQHKISVLSYIFLIFANLSMLFQDVIMFTGLDKLGNLVFVANLNYSDVPPQNLLLIPPAWTLGLEWMFYIIAPFIVKKTKIVLALITGSLILKAIMMHAGLTNDPWSYRFFPTEIYLFCSGVIAFDLYKKHKNKLNLKLARAISFLFIALIIAYNYLPIPSLILYSAFILALPFIFFYSKNFRFDRKTGELSYPIYLSHYIILATLQKINFFKNINHDYQFILFFPLILFVSIFLIKFIQDPIDKIRDFNVIKDSFYSKLYLFALQDEPNLETPLPSLIGKTAS